MWYAFVKECSFSDKLSPALYVKHKCLSQSSHLWCLLAFSGPGDSNFVWCYLMWCPANKHWQHQRDSFSNLSFWYHLHQLWAYCIVLMQQNVNVNSLLCLLFPLLINTWWQQSELQSVLELQIFLKTPLKFSVYLLSVNCFVL